jgi:hypothetical protein
MDFLDCLQACARDEEFVQHWLRLRGFRMARNPLEGAIDKATGFDEHIGRTFAADVWDLVWLRLREGA